MGPPRDFLKSLGLSPQQNKQLQALMDAGGKEAADLRSRMDDSHRALADVLRSYSLDRDRANKLIREINRTQLRLLQARLKTQSEMRRILTADQWDRLQKGWQEAEMRRGTGPGPRGSRPGGMRDGRP
jgi:Spy/CpxP family protein refolding chaperone